jgi:Fe-S-cluster containining protein
MREEGRQKVRKLEELYARIPKFDCRRSCCECCGPVVWSRAEWERLPEYLRRNTSSATCPYLRHDGKCEIYDRRPLMCRLYGAVRRLACPYNAPEKFLTKEEEDAILKEYAKISGE